jgi:hypothetical protein
MIMEMNLFNLSEETMQKLEQSAASVEKIEEATVVSYGCICCGIGICCAGIADD